MKLRKILRKSQRSFQHDVKKIEAQTKLGFLIKKRVLFYIRMSEEVKACLYILKSSSV